MLEKNEAIKNDRPATLEKNEAIKNDRLPTSEKTEATIKGNLKLVSEKLKAV